MKLRFRDGTYRFYRWGESTFRARRAPRRRIMKLKCEFKRAWRLLRAPWRPNLKWLHVPYQRAKIVRPNRADVLRWLAEHQQPIDRPLRNLAHFKRHPPGWMGV